MLIFFAKSTVVPLTEHHQLFTVAFGCGKLKMDEGALLRLEDDPISRARTRVWECLKSDSLGRICLAS